MVKGELTFLIFLFLVLTSFISAGELKVTEEHPFLINGHWIDASQLKVGDELTLVNGSKVRVTSLEDIVSNESFKVYNLEAGEYHNFVVGKEGVVVHNSNEPTDIFADDVEVIQAKSLIPSEGRMTQSRLEILLLKPIKGNPIIAKQQARDAVEYINYETQPDHVNLEYSLLSQRGDFGSLSAEPREVEMYTAVLEILKYGNDRYGSTAKPTWTAFARGKGSRFEGARVSSFRNLPGLKDGKTYLQRYPYVINFNGKVETVYVEHKMAYLDDDYIATSMWGDFVKARNLKGEIAFEAKGGVLGSKTVHIGEMASLPKLTVLLDDLANTAVNAPTKIERAWAIAEWEWVNAVTTPSGFGGGSVLMQRDYLLLEAAGFKITEISFRRVELEALSRTRDSFIESRVQELMRR